MGWDNNVHVPVHTQARQQALLFSSSVAAGVGWGGIITLMFLYTHRHGNLTICLAVLQTQALLFHPYLLVGWGGVGWGGYYLLCVAMCVAHITMHNLLVI